MDKNEFLSGKKTNKGIACVNLIYIFVADIIRWIYIRTQKKDF